MATPKRTGTAARMKSPMGPSTSVLPEAWTASAPFCLPSPTTSILFRPLWIVTFEDLMRLDSVDDDDPVGSVGMLIDIDRNVVDDAQLDDLHR